MREHNPLSLHRPRRSPDDVHQRQIITAAARLPPQSRVPERIPNLAALPGTDLHEKALSVVDAANEVIRRRLALEAARLAAKAAIRSTTTVGAIRAVSLENRHV